MNITDLHNAVAAVCPISGLVGKPDEREQIKIQFLSSATEDQKTAARAALLAYVEPPIPDPLGFLKAINDSALPDEAKFQLTPYLGLVHTYAHDPEGTKAAWLRVKTMAALDAGLASVIEAAAAQFGMPL